MGDAEYTCRTCGKDFEQENSTELFPMFTSSEYRNELKMILSEFEMWNLNISENDGLPQKICITCFDSFCQIHNFRIMCEEAQNNFNELCTGLDIIIKMEPDFNGDFDSDLPEDYEGEQVITIQEHYRFPRNHSANNTKPASDPKIVTKSNTNTQDTEAARQEEIDELNEDVPEFKPHRCEFCMDVVSFDDPDLLNDHYNALHSTNLPYLCPKCDKCFDTKFKRNVHAKVHYRILVECEICGKKVRGGKPMMAQHNELHHIEMDRECLTCGRIFPKATLKTFNYHMSWHDDAKLHKCKYCEKKFIQITHLVVHEKSHTGACVYQCYECGIGFANEELLSEHKKNYGHMNEIVEEIEESAEKEAYKKANFCQICNKLFRSNVSFRLHNYKSHGAPPALSVKQMIKIKPNHALVKPYKCSKCPESFILHTQLVMHMKKHDENRPYKCKICFKKFKVDKNLKSHVDSVHLKKKKYICKTCGCGFVYRHFLVAHIGSKHKDLKEYKCETCGKIFGCEKTFKRHMLSHNESKPFECTICSKCFNHPSVLKAHVKTHLKIEKKKEATHV